MALGDCACWSARRCARSSRTRVEFEPLQVPMTGITDYAQVAGKYAELATARGAELKDRSWSHRISEIGGRSGRQTRTGDFAAR